MKNFLKRIELQGFKSFAGKTVLEFPERVTAVVGPNGSGKSNVIDAFRWVLGEREAKQLRGDTLNTLIFAGTPKKPAVSLAKVALYFDNESRVFPIDAEEVMLVRKIDRSGVSQFFLHDAEVRLRDLVPMLARARLGSRGLTMVGQGQSDLFVKSSPVDRRGMIEEVLGLREYRLKKAQSERQLATSETNLEKVHAMLEELGPHLRFLRRQKSRFEKRAEIETTLREIEDAFFAHKYRGIQKEIEGLSEPTGSITAEIRAKEAAIHAFQKTIDETYRRTTDSTQGKQIRQEISTHIEKRSALERELARVEAKIEMGVIVPAHAAYSLQEIERAVHDLAREVEAMLVWTDLEQLKTALREWQTKLNRFTEPKEAKKAEVAPGLEEERERLHVALKAIDEAIHALQTQEESAATEQQALNQSFRAQIEELEGKKNELRTLTEKVRMFAFEKEKLHLRLEEVKREWQGFGRTITELEALPDGLPVPDEDAERKMFRLRSEIAAIGEIDTNLIQEADESEKRYTFLHRELEDTKTAIVDLRGLIKELEHKIHEEFKDAFHKINEEFNNYFRLMFNGGHAKMRLAKYEPPETQEASTGTLTEGETAPVIVQEEEKKDHELTAGVEIELSLPRKKITSLDMLSGGEKSLVSLAALFSLIAVSPPPFLVLDEIDAPLDEENARRFSELIKNFSGKTQFIVVTHNRATMEAADILYGVTMGDDGVSKVLSLKMEG